jgi:hypothetical protein
MPVVNRVSWLMPRIEALRRPISDTAGTDVADPKHRQGKVTTNARELVDRVTELRVSAHLMMLEVGVYCIFPAPGSPKPDPFTGLPGVRVTPAPRGDSKPDAVSVTTFRPDGWLDGTAALVRVTDSPAKILVSVYQNMTQRQDAAPRLQVLSLIKEPNADAFEHDPGASRPAMKHPSTQTRPAPEIMAHVKGTGDVSGKIGEWIGAKGGRQWLEGFGLAPGDGIASEEIEYQGVLGRNWLSPWIEGGKYCGSRGMALPLLGLKIRLKGGAAKAFECAYSATFIDGSAVGPINADEACQAETMAPLEAFQIVIRRRSLKEEGAKKVREKKPFVESKVKTLVKSKTTPVVRHLSRR